MSRDDAEDVVREARLHDDLMTEYYVLIDAVAGFDQRLLTIKSWGVTFAMTTLALGFQQEHYGLFLVAAASAVGFWLIEASTKRHQMRYYPRIADIEVFSYELYGHDMDQQARASSPLIDWGWHTAPRRVWGESRLLGRRGRLGRVTRGWQDAVAGTPHQPQRWPDLNPHPGASSWIMLWPAIALPHAVAAALGIGLFCLGVAGRLGPI